MTDTAATDAPRRKKGKGAGRPPPTVVINGLNLAEHFPPPKPKIGAPTIYSEEMADRICEWVLTGRPLSAFCALHDTPSSSTIYRWFDAYPAFWEKYARARIQQTYALTDTLIDPAIKNLSPDQVPAMREWHTNVKWCASKVAPELWGDKLDVKTEVTGANGGAIQVDMLLNVLLTPQNLERLTDIEVESIRSAAAKLALPAPGPVIDAVATSVAGAASAAPGDVAALSGDDESGEDADDD